MSHLLGGLGLFFGEESFTLMTDLQPLKLFTLKVGLTLLIACDISALNHYAAVLLSRGKGPADQGADDVVQELLICLYHRDERAAIVGKTDVLGSESDTL